MRKKWKGDFPGSPVVMTPCFQCRGMSSIPGQGTKIPHYSWHGQKKKKEKTGGINLLNFQDLLNIYINQACVH